MSMKSQDAFLRALAVSEKHIDDVLRGITMIEGKPCTIKSIESIDGGQRVTFQWTADDGTTKTQTMDVMDGIDGADGQKGDKGDPGVGLPEGGTVGQVLVKKSSTDYDMEWGTPGGGGDMLKSVYDTDNDGKVNSAENADTVGGFTVAKDVPADAKFTDTVYDDTEIREEITDKVDKVSGKGLSTEDYTSEEKTKLAGVEASAEVNTIESITLNGTEVTPDANKNVALTVITNAVNDLVNYYLKSETYSKTEVDDIVTAIKNSRFEVVATLPTTDIKTNVIYLVPKNPTQTSNVKDEYINLDGTTAGWEKIGDTEIDLSDYVTTQALNTALANYTTTADLTTLLAGKQDTLTFDNAPTENSNNPVKSDGIYADEKAIYEVMGQNGAKNKEPFDIDVVKALNTTGTWTGNSYELNGITFAFADDGKVTVSGTASALCSINISGNYDLNGDYIITGCPSGGGGSTYSLRIYDSSATVVADDVGEGVSFTANNLTNCRTNLIVRKDAAISTPIVFAPMIRDSKDTDPTYQPYAKTNSELTAENQTLTNQANDMVNVYGSKNLLPNNAVTKTVNGVTFTVNSDGSVTANGTSTAYTSLVIAQHGEASFFDDLIGKPIKLSGCPSGGASNTYKLRFDYASGNYVDDIGEGIIIIPQSTYSNTWYVEIGISGGVTVSNLTFYPMIRLASIQDDTWVPYVPTNKELMSCKLNGYVGAKNLLPYPYKNTTKSENGVTFTDNGDGTITVNTPTSASAETTFYLSQSIQSILDTGMYILSGCPSGGNRASGYFMEFAELTTSSSNWKMFGTDTGEGAIAHIDSTRYVIHAYIRIRSGATVSNLTFKPMIRRVEDTDPTWQPYAKTNRELTDALAGFELAIYEGTAPADTTDYKTENVQTALGFKPSYFTILAAERYNTTNSIWYQISNDMTATDYVIKAASDSNGVDYRVKFSDVTNYTKYRVVILYKR